ncbi:hypothetical protein Pden_3362 [Paracoccus denitrificans PD1222]|uniref:Uncharacterized protein n=1 Tax=Paracoccus denitrificans (strain Pd 1222) TaxID=318586 RepID=A1B7E1_PARDP|nr:hypothetical protein Pden_3362 [Paracoccus denitrificans PD1222]
MGKAVRPEAAPAREGFPTGLTGRRSSGGATPADLPSPDPPAFTGEEETGAWEKGLESEAAPRRHRWASHDRRRVGGHGAFCFRAEGNGCRRRTGAATRVFRTLRQGAWKPSKRLKIIDKTPQSTCIKALFLLDYS